MGDYSRTRRPNRETNMARLRIILVLVLSAHIKVSNSMTQKRPEVHNKAGFTRSEVYSKAGVSRPEIHGKPGVSHLEVHSKAGISRPEVYSKVSVSYPEVDRNARVSLPKVYSKEEVSRPEVNSKVLISHQDIHRKAGVSHPEVHGKVGILSPKIFGKLLRLDRNSNQLEQTGHGVKVKNCPSDCYCQFIRAIGNQPCLVVRDCSYDPIDSLPKLFASHGYITCLALFRCRLTRLPPEIMKLPLIIVFLNINEFTELPQELLELPQLAGLGMRYNRLNCLPADIKTWSTLIVLHLEHNMIAELPQELGGMRNLQELYLTHNELQSLPEVIGELSELIILKIGYNKLASLPAEVRNLTKLKELDLSNNQLNTLNCDIAELKRLASVELSNNPLKEVPALPTESLIQFVCDNCSIQILPCELFKTHIQSLHLDYNGIRDADCGTITNNYLTMLTLVHNSLQEIPCEYYFSNMIIIAVNYNNISTIPKNCMLFGSNLIEGIYFDENKIDALHFTSFCTAGSLKHLSYIGFANNRISTIDTSDSPLHQCFKTGAVIELQGNMLSTLDSWPMVMSQDKQISVDVSDNNLSVFTSSTGSFLRASQFGSNFTMQRNQIRHFMDIFNGWKVIVNTTESLNTLLKNNYFDLGFNPLVCDCIDYEVYRYIQTLQTEQYNNLVCHEPMSLRGQNPHHIPLGDFVCDVDLNCPDGCTCIEVPYSQTINVTCLNYNQTDIPIVVPDLLKPSYEYRLDICHQNLHEITFRPYLVKTTEIRLSNNSVTAIKFNSSHVLRMVRVLHIDDNMLQRLPDSVAGMSNESLVEIRLGSNPWVCDCEAMAMKNWIMRNWHIVKDKDIILCHSPPNMVDEKVINIERYMVCPNETAVFILGAICIAILIFLICLYINDRLKYDEWRLVGSDECEGEHKEFDIFMCACSALEDAAYVEDFLIPELERRDFRVCYHREHFCGGKPIHVNMSEAIEKSKRTLVFFSNGFRESGYSMFEFHSAYDLDIQNKTRRLVTIKDTGLDMHKLDIAEIHYFRKHTYIARADVKFWKLLEGTLPKRRLGGNVRR